MKRSERSRDPLDIERPTSGSTMQRPVRNVRCGPPWRCGIRYDGLRKVLSALDRMGVIIFRPSD